MKIYPNTLKPDGTEQHIINGKEFHIPVAHHAFKQWVGEPIANTFGNKGLIDYEGVPMFAELAIQRTAVKAGWGARWVETYAMKGKIPYYFTQWGDSSLALQAQEPIDDQTQVNLLASIAHNNNNSYSGCWDILIWKGGHTIFVESKRNKKDKFRITQDRWLQAGVRTGLTADNFLIVQWDYV